MNVQTQQFQREEKTKFPKIFLNINSSGLQLLLLPVAEMDTTTEEDEVADIREQIFHNTVREHIVSGGRSINKFQFGERKKMFKLLQLQRSERSLLSSR